MPEHLRALVVILGIATAVFVLVRRHATAVAIDPADFARRRNLWFVITLVAFLSGNFWIYVAISAVILLLMLSAEHNRLALFIALVFAVPPVSAAIGGLGFLNQLFPLNHVRLLSLLVLLPTFLKLLTDPGRLKLGRIWPDRLLIAYLGLVFAVGLYSTTFTDALRLYVFVTFLDVFLPYYVASRALRDIKAFRDVAMTLTVTALVMSGIAVFEVLKHWLVYPAMVYALDVAWGFGVYVGRGAIGLRAQVSTGHPIAAGFVFSVALGLALYARTLIPNGRARTLCVLGIVAGLIAALSRGPWLGAAATLLTFIALGPGAGRRVAKYAVIVIATFFLLQSFPAGRAVIDLLPFVGTVDEGNIDYRRQLMDVAFDAIWASPLFGGIDIYNLESSRVLDQGGGFIDLVNTYIGIMLGTGFVGLSLFLGFFATACYPLFRVLRSRRAVAEEDAVLGRALLATISGVLITILTTSSISVIPTVYWLSVGLVVSARHVIQGRASSSARRSNPMKAAQGAALAGYNRARGIR